MRAHSHEARNACFETPKTGFRSHPSQDQYHSCCRLCWPQKGQEDGQSSSDADDEVVLPPEWDVVELSSVDRTLESNRIWEEEAEILDGVLGR